MYIFRISDTLYYKKIIFFKKMYTSFQVRFSSFAHYTNTLNKIPICVLAFSGFYNNKNRIICYECGFEYNDFNIISNILLQHNHFKFMPSCSQAVAATHTVTMTATSATNSPPPPLSNIYWDEQERIRSFNNVTMLFCPQLLASAGFYMVPRLSIGNTTMIEQLALQLSSSLFMIKCCSCNYECLLFKNSFQNTMFKSPFDDHIDKSSMVCSFVKKDKSLLWIKTLLLLDRTHIQKKIIFLPESGKIEDILVSRRQTQHDSDDDITVKGHFPSIVYDLIDRHTETKREQQPLQYPSSNTHYDDLHTMLDTSDKAITADPIHPKYISYEERLQSFKKWPLLSAQQPCDLAKSGFFYVGISDSVKCFFCNGGLRQWDIFDDPFEDHVRYFPNCQYIRHVLGDRRITESNVLTPPPPQRLKRALSARTIEARLDMNIIPKIVESSTSLTRQSIQSAYENQTLGNEFPSPIHLTHCALDLEEFNSELCIGQFLIWFDPTVLITTEYMRRFFLQRYFVVPTNIR